jgi:nickel-dependent lactate racemase
MCAGAVVRPAAGATHQTLTLRTHEWFGDRLEEFKFPATWHISVQHMKGYQTAPLEAADIARAVQTPFGTKPLREIAAGKKTAAIGFDDLTRPTPTSEVVPHVIAELRAAGILDENILFVTAYGAHYQMNGQEVEKKLGDEAVRRHPWINHNVWENLVELGGTRAGNQILVNTYDHKADVRITLSGLKAHGTPGYGGGPKAVLPGLSGMKSIRYMHEEIKRAPRPEKDADGIPIFRVWENEQRQDMIEAARRVGVDFSAPPRGALRGQPPRDRVRARRRYCGRQRLSQRLATARALWLGRARIERRREHRGYQSESHGRVRVALPR